jgi:hypothetical protein
MLRKFAGFAILAAAVSAVACGDQRPSTSAVNSFGAPLSLSSAAPLVDILGFNPGGNVTMMLTTTTDHESDITSGTATFSGNLSGFPAGSSITSAHVNNGAAGTTGPVVIDLQIQDGQVVFGLGGASSLSATVPVSATTASAILANPQNYYFEVDTAAFPTGLLRGQFGR